MKDDHGSHLRVQAEEAALELVSVGDDGLHASGRVDIGHGQVRVDPMAPEPPCLIDAGTHEQPVEPLVEAVGFPEGGQVASGTNEGVLHRVLRLVRVPENEPGGGIQSGDRGGRKLGEGVMIALPSSLHEVSLHHALGE